jgi:hypothetical protein
MADRVGLQFSPDFGHPLEWAVRSDLLRPTCLVHEMGLRSVARIGDGDIFSKCPLLAAGSFDVSSAARYTCRWKNPVSPYGTGVDL